MRGLVGNLNYFALGGTRSFVVTSFLLNLKIIFSIWLDRFDRRLTARFIKRYFDRKRERFTLVELIVVVVIIGILSSIAVASFQNTSWKVRQRGFAAQISTYIKGYQTFYNEYDSPIRNAGDLIQFADFIKCRSYCISVCKGQANNQRKIGPYLAGSTQRSSTSGMYKITMRIGDQNRFRLNAFPLKTRLKSINTF